MQGVQQTNKQIFALTKSHSAAHLNSIVRTIVVVEVAVIDFRYVTDYAFHARVVLACWTHVCCPENSQ